jgi:hypothetical protein
VITEAELRAFRIHTAIFKKIQIRTTDHLMNWNWLLAVALCTTWCGSPSAQTGAQPSKWKVEKRVDKLDGSRAVTLSVESTDTLEISGRKTRPAVLSFRCINDRTDITVQWPTYFSTPWSNVRWRVDGGTIIEEIWHVDGQARNFLTHSKGTNFIQRWMDKKTLIFSVNKSPEPQTLTFPIAGLDQSFLAVMAPCGGSR